MDWSDHAIVLSATRHGETSLRVMLMTREHGRHAGLARGGSSPRSRGIYQPGNVVRAAWRARLAEHLGTVVCELASARAAALLDDRRRLLGLSAACAMVEAAVPEREPHAAVYEGLLALLDALTGSEAWAETYVGWELGLLAELGFGLDLGRCAVTGGGEDLVYVSPRSGRAVSAAVGAPYRDRLLALPGFLRGAAPAAAADIVAGLRLSGWFLHRHVLAAPLPPARMRLEAEFARNSTISCGIERP